MAVAYTSNFENIGVHVAQFSRLNDIYTDLATYETAFETQYNGNTTLHFIDGAIDTAFIRDTSPARYALKAEDGILNPDHIAENYWYLHAQPRDAWTFELDLRPWKEKW